MVLDRLLTRRLKLFGLKFNNNIVKSKIPDLTSRRFQSKYGVN